MMSRRSLLMAVLAGGGVMAFGQASTQGFTSKIVRLIILETGPGFTGFFGYSGPPTLNNLILSITANGGTDPYGNVYLPGMTSYDPTGPFVSVVSTFGGILSFYKAPTEAGPYTLLAGISINSAGALGGMLLEGGLPLEVQTGINLDGVSAAPATPSTSVQLYYIPGSPGILFAKGPSGAAVAIAST